MADLVTLTRRQLEEELREARAEAWERGHSAGIAAYATQTRAKDNPYREQA